MSIILKALLTAISLLGLGWLIHFLIWRIKRPEAYPYWIPAIFIATFLGYLSYLYFNGRLNSLNDYYWILLVLLPYGLMAITYFMAYAGVIEYSPSVEILLEIKKHMPGGIKKSELVVTTLPEDMLTNLRVAHLLESKMIERLGDQYQITNRGNKFKRLLMTYRKLLGLHFPGEG